MTQELRCLACLACALRLMDFAHRSLKAGHTALGFRFAHAALVFTMAPLAEAIE